MATVQDGFDFMRIVFNKERALKINKEFVITINIVDAMEPGGSGNMYAGLNEEQRDALLEVTKMGFPSRA